MNFVMMSRSEREIFVSILFPYYTTKSLILLENRLEIVTEDGIIWGVLFPVKKLSKYVFQEVISSGIGVIYMNQCPLFCLVINNIL